MKRVDLNSILLTLIMLLLAVLGFFARDFYKDIRSQVRATHDDVIAIKIKLPDMIPRAEFEVRMSQVKSEQQRTDAAIEAIKVELSKMPHR